MNDILLNQLLQSFKVINLKTIQINFMVFMNNHNYHKPIFDLEESCITYIPLEEEFTLEIASARTFLQQHIFKYCQKEKTKPIVWLLDEDIEIDFRVNHYLPKLIELKQSSYDVLIGSIEGDSPNAAFSGMRVQLLDLIENLKWLDSLDDNELLPSRHHLNQMLIKKFPNYYYDLTSDKDKGHLNKVFWIIPLHEKETVNDARKRIYAHLVDILSGKNFFRPIIQVPINTYKQSLLRGANTFILNLNTLQVKQPKIQIESNIIRRSDMLWALVNQEFFNRKIIKVDFTVLHRRQKEPKKELTVEKTLNELYGSIIFNALKLFYENKKEKNFKEIIDKQVNSKIFSVQESFNKTKEYIEILNQLNDSRLKSFCQELKAFYTSENSNLIIQNIEKIKSSQEYILKKFETYKEEFPNYCNLITSDYGVLKQYDLKDDNIKLLSKKVIEEMDKRVAPLVRIHSSCTNSEVFHANDCDCASQLKKAMKMISNSENGMLFYLNQEGRGHGYSNKIAIVKKMQEEGLNTYEACNALGLKDDVRDYKKVCDFLKKIGFTKIKLMSNNPKKIKNIESNGIHVLRKRLVGECTDQNIDYLKSKQIYGGHYELIITEEKLIETYLNKKNKIEFYEKEDAYGKFSNFSDYPFVSDGKYWRTSEHYYQASKFEKYSEIYNSIQEAKTPTLAKEIAHFHKVDNSWENKKISFMYRALYKKFTQNHKLKALLLNTENFYIVEKAQDDDFWGSGENGEGKNILGRLLMFLRDELR